MGAAGRTGSSGSTDWTGAAGALDAAALRLPALRSFPRAGSWPLTICRVRNPKIKVATARLSRPARNMAVERASLGTGARLSR
jgi:hypothetical protein